MIVVILEGLADWDLKSVLSFDPKCDGWELTPFKSKAIKEYQSTEYYCASEFLNEFNVPLIDKKAGETYSLVGRIQYLINKEKGILQNASN